MSRARFAAVTLSAAPPKVPGPRMRTSANTSVPRSSAIRSISPCRQRQLRSSTRRPAARSSSAHRSSARAPLGFMAVLTELTGPWLTSCAQEPCISWRPRSETWPTPARAPSRSCARPTSSPARTRAPRARCSCITVALHQHNERAAAAALVEALRAGKNVALVSDAGTPALADPGAWLVAEAHRAGIRVSPIPGPSAAAAAFSAAGFAAAGFRFAGFLPAAGAARRRALEALEAPWPVILYEAPHRVARTLADLAARFGPE